MILLFDAVSRSGYIALYSEQRECLFSHSFEIAGNESSKTLEIISWFLKSHGISSQDISNIVCVTGPWSFTGIRTISLVINSFAYIYPHILLTPVNYFDLFQSYPIAKSSSRRDLFVKYEKDAIIQVLSNGDFQSSIEAGTIVYGDVSEERFEKAFLYDSTIDYKAFMQTLELQKLKRIAPNYIKKPNIT